MAISKKVKGFLEKASWIRTMFEQGAVLKKQYGDENVFDFSLGNPNLEPPDKFFEVLEAVVSKKIPGKHAYMSNAGYTETRDAVAEYISEEHGIEIFGKQVIMTCGAGGGLNVVLKTLLDPGDEVIIPVPCFVEYHFYVDNHGGICTPVPTRSDFSLDLGALESAITHRTKAVLINSPNNPTGIVYNRQSIEGLAAVLAEKSRRMGRQLYLLSDEPYSKIVYDGVTVPSVLQAYPASILITSYSKDLSIPGERLGFIAVNPQLTSVEELVNGLIFSNRTLGFVNAPALMQRVVCRLQGLSVDIQAYKHKRDLLCSMLSELGYEFVKPAGAFYLFPKSPLNDDVAFVKELLSQRILAVPGSGFGGPGFFRLSYCVDDSVIEKSAAGFKKLARRYIA